LLPLLQRQLLPKQQQAQLLLQLQVLLQAESYSSSKMYLLQLLKLHRSKGVRQQQAVYLPLLNAPQCSSRMQQQQQQEMQILQSLKAAARHQSSSQAAQQQQQMSI
jgi:hypothetical protein